MDDKTKEPITDLQETSLGLLPEEEAARLLNISERTIKNMVYNGKMPADHYTTAVTGKRFYFRDKLLGITK